MITIINFSHPIPDDDESNANVYTIIGDMFIIRNIRVQLDLNAPLVPQAKRLVDAAIAAANDNIRSIDLIRLPGYAEAAALVINEFQTRGYMPNILRFASVTDAIPTRFEAVEVIRLYGWGERQWIKFTWALKSVHGQTPRDLFNEYRKSQEEETE